MTVKLPVVSSMAASTSFCAERIDGPGGISLWVDGNGKITRGNGSYEAPRPNAFSLVQVEDCPGSTPTCRASCYVHNLEKHAADTHALYRQNSRAIREILVGPDRGSWAVLLATWICDHAEHGFRWHVSGDIFSREYAEFIAVVVATCEILREHEDKPHVPHWIYTRSFGFVDELVGLPSLALNLSCDPDNYDRAREIRETVLHLFGQSLRLCYLTLDGTVPADLPPGSVIFPDYALRGARGATPAENRASSPWWQSLAPEQRRMVCPVDFYGADEKRRCGPCMKCLEPTI